jgi:hypothetical protein
MDDPASSCDAVVVKRPPRAVLWAVGVCAAAAAVTAGVVLGIGHNPTPTPSQPSDARAFATAPATPAPPLNKQRGDQIARDLDIASADSLRDAIALPAGQVLDPAAGDQLRSLGITLEVSTFHDNGDGTATVTAHLAHPAAGAPADWTVHLIDEDGQWKISLTEPDR